MTNPTSLSYIAAREHIGDLTRSADQARLVRIARERERDSRRGSPIAWIARRLPRRIARRTSTAPAVAPPACIEP